MFTNLWSALCPNLNNGVYEFSLSFLSLFLHDLFFLVYECQVISGLFLTLILIMAFTVYPSLSSLPYLLEAILE